MLITELIKVVNGKLLTKENNVNNQFNGIYTGDLLSNIMAHAKEDMLLITIMCNINTIAVASLKDLPVILFCEGKTPTNEMIEKANELNINLITTSIDAVSSIRKICQYEILL